MTTHATGTDASGARPFTATTLGYPRIGRHRELKSALEAYWAGRLPDSAVRDAWTAVRDDGWRAMTGAGLDSVPVGVSSLYDQVLDAALLVGAVPERFRDMPAADDRQWLDRYSALARGTTDLAPLEMTKWFDTNYHYLVPEIGPDTPLDLQAERLVEEVRQAVAHGVPARPVLVGPATLLLLSKPTEGSPKAFRCLDRLDEVVELYAALLPRLAGAGASWVQLDEPSFVCDRTPEEIDALGRALRTLAGVPDRPAVLVGSYFGDLGPALPVIAESGVEAVAVDLVAGTAGVAALAGVPALQRMTVVAGVVDGRNVWRTDLPRALSLAGTLLGISDHVAVSTSCSLLHVPYDLAAEPSLPTAVVRRLAFADQKLGEVVMLGRALRGAVPSERTADPASPPPRDDRIRARLEALRPEQMRREPYEQRRTAQQERLGLPVLPVTTIGSFPQTPEIRAARSRFRSGALEEAAYTEAMRAEIARVVALQESLGIDVIVHGEPERNDMVQYFAEQLDGYATTVNGWVQSYGTRCVRPPILHGDVARPAPMTVPWATYAQSLTTRPVKGMLTGPVTMLAWSFVRNDQPIGETALQVALAIRDEVHDLERAGLRIIQVDEPALRELLPLRADDQPAYREWSVSAFRLATSGISPATQIHTHLCYSEFDTVVDAIDGLDADVTSIEAARSRMEILPAIAGNGFARGIGPGVYDIHSPRVPDGAEVRDLLREALTAIPVERLWVNPDCGLKTRGYAEVEPALEHLVSAARALREELVPAG